MNDTSSARRPFRFASNAVHVRCARSIGDTTGSASAIAASCEVHSSNTTPSAAFSNPALEPK
jgi:hypothetical protein